MVHMNYVTGGTGALVNENGEEQPLKAGYFALVDPDEKHVPEQGWQALQDDLRGAEGV